MPPAMKSARELKVPDGAPKKAEKFESVTAPVKTSGSGLVSIGATKPKSKPKEGVSARKLKALALNSKEGGGLGRGETVADTETDKDDNEV